MIFTAVQSTFNDAVRFGLPARPRTTTSVRPGRLRSHASIALTLDTYSHVLPGMGGEAASAIEDALG